jgi:hypothetical protein
LSQILQHAKEVKSTGVSFGAPLDRIHFSASAGQ